MARYQLSRQSDEDLHVDKGRLSRKLCIVGLAFCWLIGFVSLAAGLYLVRTGGVVVRGPRKYPITVPGGIATRFTLTAEELVPLGLNIIVTICTDITGYIHTISLR